MSELQNAKEFLRELKVRDLVVEKQDAVEIDSEATVADTLRLLHGILILAINNSVIFLFMLVLLA